MKPLEKIVNDALSDCSFKDYSIEWDSEGDIVWIEASYMEADTITGKQEMQWTRKWLIEEHFTQSEIVSTVFKMCLTSMEHRTREWFTYRNRAIYQPHHSVYQLHAVCEERPVSV